MSWLKLSFLAAIVACMCTVFQNFYSQHFLGATHYCQLIITHWGGRLSPNTVRPVCVTIGGFYSSTDCIILERSWDEWRCQWHNSGSVSERLTV